MKTDAFLARELVRLRAKHPHATNLLALNRADAVAIVALDACRRAVGLAPITQADFTAASSAKTLSKPTGKRICISNRKLF